MSDRFVLHAPKQEIEIMFGVSSGRDDYFEPNYNIAPGSLHPVIMENKGERMLKQAKWGLIPPDADDEREGRDHFDLQPAEADEHSWIAAGLEQRRCLIPANGFYKWKTTQKKTTPFYIRLLSNELMALGGIYSIWKSSGGRNVYSFAILTTPTNALIEPVGERMPAIVRSLHFEEWLAEGTLNEKLFSELLLKPYPMTEMAVNRVSEEVNDTSNNNPELIQPIPK